MIGLFSETPPPSGPNGTFLVRPFEWFSFCAPVQKSWSANRNSAFFPEPAPPRLSSHVGQVPQDDSLYASLAIMDYLDHISRSAPLQQRFLFWSCDFISSASVTRFVPVFFGFGQSRKINPASPPHSRILQLSMGSPFVMAVGGHLRRISLFSRGAILRADPQRCEPLLIAALANYTIPRLWVRKLNRRLPFSPAPMPPRLRRCAGVQGNVRTSSFPVSFLFLLAAQGDRELAWPPADGRWVARTLSPQYCPLLFHFVRPLFPAAFYFQAAIAGEEVILVLPCGLRDGPGGQTPPFPISLFFPLQETECECRLLWVTIARTTTNPKEFFRRVLACLNPPLSPP